MGLTMRERQFPAHIHQQNTGRNWSTLTHFRRKSWPAAPFQMAQDGKRAADQHLKRGFCGKGGFHPSGGSLRIARAGMASKPGQSPDRPGHDSDKPGADTDSPDPEQPGHNK